MRKIIPIIIFLFIYLPNKSIADDINDYQLEGISIGDSLLKYFSKSYIEKKKLDLKFGKKKYKDFQKIYKKKNNNNYDNVVLYFKSKDNKYEIKRISARKYYKNKIEACYKTQNIIATGIEKQLQNSEKIETGIQKIKSYPNSQSYAKHIYFYLKNYSMIIISCYDYSKKDTRSKDRLSVIFDTREYSDWKKSIQ